MTKTLENLPDDIYALFDPSVNHVVDEDNLDQFCENLKQVMRTRLLEQKPRDTVLRFSSLGKPDRQLWYDAHPVDGMKEPMTPKTFVKFLYGDILEQVILFLTKEAGHDVQGEQMELEVGGVKGHIDAIIDGVVVDVKSASPFGYKKFKDEAVTEDDPFGYVAQLSGYSDVLNPGKPAAWVAIEKVSGDICVSNLKSTVIKHHPPGPRIEHLKEVIVQPEPPERCFDDVPDGKSGNMKLDTGCSYCAHKFRCWPGLRTFIYSTGPRFLTHVERVPDVLEIT